MLCACTRRVPAPVVDGWKQPLSISGDYRVQPADTLYSIAWAFNLDYRRVAYTNHLKPPYRLHVGKHLILKVSPRLRLPLPRAHVSEPVPLHWRWPTHGCVAQTFSGNAGGNKGIDILGHYGQAVYASASGEVVYRGAGLRGYGPLVIIKHNDSYLSAYAYNKLINVREGEHVKAGQLIARMGQNDAGRVRLHFEIRRNGRPVNPLRYLKRSSMCQASQLALKNY